MARVFVDTTAIYALLDRDDAHHGDACQALERLGRARSEPVITNFIRAECHALLLVRLGSEVACRWLAGNVWPTERVTAEDEAEAVELIRTHVDQKYSFTDATSFAVMKRLRMRKALAFDRHFDQFGCERA